MPLTLSCFLQEEKQKKSLAAKLELAKFLQETIAEMARRNKAQAGAETERFSTYVQKVSSHGRPVSLLLVGGGVQLSVFCFLGLIDFLKDTVVESC